MNSRKFIKHLLVYFLLIAGYFFLYVINVDAYVHPKKDGEVKSRTNFVYQQF